MVGVHVKRKDEIKNQPQRGSIQQCQIKPNNDDTTRQTNCLHKMATEIKNIINRSFALAETFNKINTLMQHDSKSLDMILSNRNVRLGQQLK